MTSLDIQKTGDVIITPVPVGSDEDLCEALRKVDVWVRDKHQEAKTMRKNLTNDLDRSLDIKAFFLQVKQLVSEAKLQKACITGLLQQGNDHSLNNPDKPLDFDLDHLKWKWLELKQLLKDLGREGRLLAGSSDHQVYLTYSNTDQHTVSTGILFPSPNSRTLAINRKDPNKSFLKEKGRRYVTKLSIPYRVFIKSKVKQRYFGRRSADTSFADTSLSEFSFDSSSLDSSRCHSPGTITTQHQLSDNVSTSETSRAAVPEGRKDDRKYNNTTTTHCTTRSEEVGENHTIEKSKKNTNNNLSQEEEEKVVAKEKEFEVEDIMAQVESGRGSPKSPGKGGARASPVPIEQYSPITSKRRRLNSDDDSASSICSLSPREGGSPRSSPIPMTNSPTPLGKALLAERLAMMDTEGGLASAEDRGSPSVPITYPVPEVMRGYGPSSSPPSLLSGRYQDYSPGTLSPMARMAGAATPGEDLMNLTFEGIDSSMSSNVSTPMDSPYPTLSRDFRKKLKKDELWAAIQSDYHYLMDDEIIETCKSTESDLSWESDEVSSGNTNVSFTEFLKQYKELTDWLNQIQAVTQRNGSSHSERYLNQSYHEEMLQRSPRRKLFNDYARQLMRRYPTMREEIQARLLRVNTQWEEIEKAVVPGTGEVEEEAMLRNLEEDLSSMRSWLHKVEVELSTQVLSLDWSPEQIRLKIEEHKLLQQDIESHSKLVSAVLKVCERLQSDTEACDHEKDSVKLVATNLERRWHAIWIQSLEWECRLEELQQGKLPRKRLVLSEDSDEELVTSTPIGTQTECGGVSSDCGTDPIAFSSPFNRHTNSNTTSVKPRHLPQHVGESEAESDASNYDIIPFSEHEYEKILVETDTPQHSDDDVGQEERLRAAEDGKSSPDSGGHYRTSSGCETDQGVESELGRSYSDHSVEGEEGVNHHKASSTGHNYTGEQHHHVPDMKASDISNRSRAANEESVKRDASDVGYSSGSHSNEELEVKGRKSHKKTGGDKATKDKPEATSSPNLGNQRKTWRNSATSAYDTCSTGSDPSLQLAGEDTYLDLHNTSSDVATVTSASFQSIGSTPHTSPETGRRTTTTNVNFYHMTSIETDTDPASSVEPPSTYSYTADHGESGNTSDIDSELSKSLDIPYDEDPAFNSCIPPIPEEEMVNETDQPKSKRRLEPLFKQGKEGTGDDDDDRNNGDELPTNDTLSQEELDSLTDATRTLLKYVGQRKPFKKTDSMSVQVDSEAGLREQTISEDEINNIIEDLPTSSGPTGPSDCVRRLIQQAESLVGDEDLNQLNNHKWPQFVEPVESVVKSKGRNKHKRKASDVVNDSFTSTDGSVRASGLPLSSCDASSEGDLSGSWSDSSEPGQPGQGHSSGLTTVIEAGSSPHGPVKLRRKNNKINTGDNRPRSVTELYEQRSGLDMAPFSISDGAIPGLEGDRSSSGKLQKYTTSDQSSSSSPQRKGGDSPRKVRRRRSPPKKGVSSGSLSRSQSDKGQDRRSMSPAAKSVGNNTTTSTIVSPGSQLTNSDTDMDTLVPVCRDTADEVDCKTSQQTLSTGEFSENAWDNYQAPPYSNYSDDGVEEKLDASHFHADWDHGLEFEEDFSQDQSYGGGAGTRVGGKKQPGKPVKRVFADSDSDLEDFQNVIAESQKALTFTHNTLTRPRKDNMDTGIYLDPSEYNETVATCRTQMKCLGVVVNTLQSEMGLTNVTADNVQQVKDIIEEWRELEHLASERLHQSQALGSLYKDLLAVHRTLDKLGAQLDYTEYRGVGELEGAVKALQSGRIDLQQQKLRVDTVLSGVVEFENNQESVSVTKFHTDIEDLKQSLDTLSQRLCSQTHGLQTALVSVYDFSEHQRELQHTLNREKDQLTALELAQALTTFTPQDAKVALQDLKKLESEFPAYNGKIQLLRTLHRDIAPFYHQDKAQEVKGDIDTLDQELTELKLACETLTIKLSQRANRESVATQAGLSTGTASASAPAAPKRSLLMRLLRASLPLQLLLLFILVLAYFMNPDMFENFGLVFSPQLRYVRGPPPT